MLTAFRRFLARAIAPVVAALVAWLGSMGLQMPPEFGEHVEQAAILLAMAIMTAVVEGMRERIGGWLGRLLGRGDDE